MNEILYADSDTDHFKTMSDKVWVLAQQPIAQSSGTAKHTSLSKALRTAIRFKHTDLKVTKHRVRFVKICSAQPKMWQTKTSTSQPSSLSKALRKAIQIKSGRYSKKIGPRMIEGTAVWTITSEQSRKNINSPQPSSFLSALKYLPQKNRSAKNTMDKAVLHQEQEVYSIIGSVCYAYQTPSVMA